MLNYLKIYGTFGILAGAVSNHTISQAHPKHLTHHQQVLSRESVLGAGILLGGGAAGAIGAYKLGTSGMSDSGGDGIATVGDCFANKTKIDELMSVWKPECEIPDPEKGGSFVVNCKFDSRALFNGTARNATVVLLRFNRPAELVKLLATTDEEVDQMSAAQHQELRTKSAQLRSQTKYQVVWKRGEGKCAAGLPTSNDEYQLFTDFDFLTGEVKTMPACPLFTTSVGNKFYATDAAVSSCGRVADNFPFCAIYDGQNVIFTGKISDDVAKPCP